MNHEPLLTIGIINRGKSPWSRAPCAPPPLQSVAAGCPAWIPGLAADEKMAGISGMSNHCIYGGNNSHFTVEFLVVISYIELVNGWLVVYLPLWKIWKSVGMMTFKKCSKPPTRYIYIIWRTYEPLSTMTDSSFFNIINYETTVG